MADTHGSLADDVGDLVLAPDRRGGGVLVDLLLVAELDEAGHSPPFGRVRELGVLRVLNCSQVATWPMTSSR